MRVMLFLLFVLGFACTRSVPVWDYSFSVLELSGTASSSSFDLPIQGAVTKRGEEIKFALTTIQGLFSATVVYSLNREKGSFFLREKALRGNLYEREGNLL